MVRIDWCPEPVYNIYRLGSKVYMPQWGRVQGFSFKGSHYRKALRFTASLD